MAIGRAIRTAVALACYGSGALAFWERLARGNVTILTYHRILPAERKKAYFNPHLAVTPECFYEHCVTLHEYFEVLPLAQAAKICEESQRPRRPVAVVTFDDGYRDNFFYALPILKKSGLHATFFPVVDLLGSDSPPWYDRLARALSVLSIRGSINKIYNDLEPAYTPEILRSQRDGAASVNQIVADSKRLAPEQRKKLVETLEQQAGQPEDWPPEDLVMDWNELAELCAQGHEVGSHGCTHEILTALDDARLEEEVKTSREKLEKGLSRPVRCFSYPNGDVDDRVADAVRRAGYSAAVTTEPGANVDFRDPYRLKRRFVDETRLRAPAAPGTNALLRMEICGLADEVFLRGFRPMRPH
jgi:peptidoglycan/xylan/chitin deacetylase (PgdA/CDA1 family)